MASNKIFLILFLIYFEKSMCTYIVQRSNGCGPHPLLALVAASRTYSSQEPSLNDILKTIKSNPEVWATMSSLIRRYDDCIRAGDGLHYKRTGNLIHQQNEEKLDPDEIFGFASTYNFT